MRYTLLCFLVALCACQSPAADPVQPSEVDVLYQVALTSSQEFDSLADRGDIKFLMARDPAVELVFNEPSYFQDMSVYSWHLDFVRSWPDYASMTEVRYRSHTLPPTERPWFTGTLTWKPDLSHPNGDVGLMGFTFYTEWGVSPQPLELLRVWERLREQVPYAADRLAWLVLLPEERAVASAVAELGVPVLDLQQVTVPAEVYSGGVNYGYLQIDPDLQEVYAHRDIVVTSTVHNDFPVVGGLITSLPGNPHSHITLRMRDRGWPSGYVPDVFNDAYLQELEGSLIRLETRQDGTVTYAEAALEEAEAHWAKSQSYVPDLQADLSVTALRDFSVITPEDAQSCGVKAANLGGIHTALAADTAGRVDGFCIPFSWYAAHIGESGINLLIDDVLADPAVWQSGDVQADRLDDIRDAIRDAPLSDELFQLILEQAEVSFPSWETTRLRFRSSTNAEDLLGLSGAGLYSSKSGCLGDDLDGDDLGPSHCLSQEEQFFLETRLAQYRAEQEQDPQPWRAELIEDIEKDLTEEKLVTEAVVKVWRSLWNDRAFQDRTFHGISHTQVYMGIAVNPSFVLEEAEAVVITSPETGAHTVVSQVSDLGVARPDVPGAIAEVAEVSVYDYNVLVNSNMLSGPIWAPDEVQRLADRITTIMGWFEPVYGPDVPLDMEIELMAGEPVVKQVRPAVTN